MDRMQQNEISCQYLGFGSSSTGVLPFNTYRTNSDSALHQSAMNPKPQEMFVGGSQELQPKRGKDPVTSTQNYLYLSMCSTLMQAANLKWQKSVWHHNVETDSWWNIYRINISGSREVHQLTDLERKIHDSLVFQGFFLFMCGFDIMKPGLADSHSVCLSACYLAIFRHSGN